MEEIKCNGKNRFKHLAFILATNPQVMENFVKLQDRLYILTSDCGIDIKCELYDNGILSYIINGLRSQIRITYDTQNKKIIRKPYKKEPNILADFGNAYCNDIIRIAEKIGIN